MPSPRVVSFSGSSATVALRQRSKGWLLSGDRLETVLLRVYCVEEAEGNEAAWEIGHLCLCLRIEAQS
jgi:hypothetical protein